MSALLDQLTTRQASVFEFIKDRVQSRGYGPTVREIGEHFQISSPNGVMCHLRALERKGLLTRVRKHDRAIARAIELAPEIISEEKGMPMDRERATAAICHFFLLPFYFFLSVRHSRRSRGR